jgi:hypothetical protein
VVNDLASKHEVGHYDAVASRRLSLMNRCFGQIPYTSLLQDFPFKGNEASLRAMEDHDMIAVSYIDGGSFRAQLNCFILTENQILRSVTGRPSMVRPGKPLYRHVFERLANG